MLQLRVQPIRMSALASSDGRKPATTSLTGRRSRLSLPHHHGRLASPRRAHEPRLRRGARDAARPGAAPVAPAGPRRSSSSARTCSPSSASSCAAPTTRSRTSPPEERARGVITASAGNHAQGVAFSARHLGLRAVIVMPQTTPEIKVEAVREPGGRGRAGRRQLLRRQGPLRRAGRGDRPRLHPSLRRSAGHRGPGHDRRGDPAPEPRAARRDLRAGGRRRPHRGHRRLHQGPDAAGQGHRRRALRGRRDVPLARRPGSGCASTTSGIFADGVAVREVGEQTFAIARALRWTRSCGSRTTRSAPPSRTSSTTRAASWSRRARSRWPGLKAWVGARGARAASASSPS